MKKLIIITLLMGAVYSCEKESMQPVNTPERTYVADQGPVQIAGNTKRFYKCLVKQHGTTLGSGEECSGQGNVCGRPTYCKLVSGSLSENEVIFEGLTRKKFIEMWNSDEGHKILLAKGVYEEVIE